MMMTWGREKSNAKCVSAFWPFASTIPQLIIIMIIIIIIIIITTIIITIVTIVTNII